MASIKFTNPKKSQVVIFDTTGSEALGKMVLEGIDHVVLHSRREVLYITPRILFGILSNLKHIKAMRYGQTDRDPVKSLKKLLGSLYRLYLLACIQYMHPKAVITFVDNSYPFQLISRIYKDAQFIAIQNGSRIRDCLKDSRPPFPQPGSIISMPLLVCFGMNDVELFKEHAHQIDTYYPGGSLKARYYKSFLSKQNLGSEFDLCLISEWDEETLSGKQMHSVRKAMVTLDDFLSRYVKEQKTSLCVALRYDNKKEEEYFLNKYGDRITLIKANREQMSSYGAVDRSGVTVAFFSTLAREAFGWGAKVLSCNFSGDAQFDFPCQGFWSMDECEYGSFKKKLDHIRTMGHEEYLRQTKACAEYIMNNRAKPSYEFVRELVLKQLDAH